MDFRLTEEQEMVRQTARDFAENELRPGVAERDDKEIFPREAVDKLGELGFMGMIVSEEWDGAGMDTVAYVIAIEEISRVDASTGIICSINNSLICYALQMHGDDYVKDTFLRKFANGTWLGAFCLTEPGSGSDALSMKSTAYEDGDEWVINGSKNWITSGKNCDAYVIVVKTDPDAGHHGTTTFVLPKDTPGITIGKPEEKMGIRATDTVSLTFQDVRVPAKNAIGGFGDGFKVMLSALDSGRLGVAAQGLGIAQGAFEEAIKYSKEREQFGKPISHFQAISFKLADMATRITAARQLLRYAAWRKDAGLPIGPEAAMAKVYCSEAATYCALEAVQIHGGYGYTKDYPVERMLRDAKITEIYEGTSEIQRIVIARAILDE
ncbi:MAG TPA: acyl-CoA dehydrogenase [Euryarchaeota archaeon]|nr:acyl-CoA dehydrogenase [bacterium BMS3Bbin04]HDH27512.1 acyl-CoA dehydrogenase [Euryarchaeota archaeon]